MWERKNCKSFTSLFCFVFCCVSNFCCRPLLILILICCLTRRIHSLGYSEKNFSAVNSLTASFCLPAWHCIHFSCLFVPSIEPSLVHQYIHLFQAHHLSSSTERRRCLNAKPFLYQDLNTRTTIGMGSKQWVGRWVVSIFLSWRHPSSVTWPRYGDVAFGNNTNFSNNKTFVHLSALLAAILRWRGAKKTCLTQSATLQPSTSSSRCYCRLPCFFHTNVFIFLSQIHSTRTFIYLVFPLGSVPQKQTIILLIITLMRKREQGWKACAKRFCPVENVD